MFVRRGKKKLFKIQYLIHITFFFFLHQRVRSMKILWNKPEKKKNNNGYQDFTEGSGLKAQ